jgi:hypothetical protein
VIGAGSTQRLARTSFRALAPRTTALCRAMFVAGVVLFASGCRQSFEFEPKPVAAEASAPLTTSEHDEPNESNVTSTTPESDDFDDFDDFDDVQRISCASDVDCPVPSLHCDVQSGGCFECIVDSDCSEQLGHRCDALHRCSACLVDEDCELGATCDRVTRRCLERCHDLDDCALGAHYCDERREVCVVCTRDQECRERERPYCAAGGAECVQCRENDQCGPFAYCDLDSGSCVGCRDSNDCLPPTFCDPSFHECSLP